MTGSPNAAQLRRHRLGLRVAEVAQLAGVTPDVVASYENDDLRRVLYVDAGALADIEVALALAEMAAEDPAKRAALMQLVPGEPLGEWAA